MEWLPAPRMLHSQRQVCASHPIDPHQHGLGHVSGGERQKVGLSREIGHSHPSQLGLHSRLASVLCSTWSWLYMVYSPNISIPKHWWSGSPQDMTFSVCFQIHSSMSVQHRVASIKGLAVWERAGRSLSKSGYEHKYGVEGLHIKGHVSSHSYMQGRTLWRVWLSPPDRIPSSRFLT